MRHIRYEAKFERMAVNLWKRRGNTAAAISAELAVTGFVLFPRQDTIAIEDGSRRSAPQRETDTEYREIADDRAFPDTPRV